MNLVDLLREYGVEPVHSGPHVTEGWAGYECPWCGVGTGKFGLGISLSTNAVSCWKCGVHSWTETLAALARIDAKEAARRVGGMPRPFERRRNDSRGKLVEPEGICELRDSPPHVRYLRGRGFNVDKVSQLWGVKAIRIAPRLAWSLYIPVAKGGEVVSWQTRKIGGTNRRYWGAVYPTQAVYPKSRLLYGGDYARNAVVVVEGVTDVWAGGPGFVATLGVGFSEAQAAMVSRYPVRAVCFDAEPKAQERARQLAERVAVFPGRTAVVALDSGKDVASARPKEVAAIRKFFLE